MVIFPIGSDIAGFSFLMLGNCASVLALGGTRRRCLATMVDVYLHATYSTDAVGRRRRLWLTSPL